MAEFAWEARTRSGELQRGTMEAEDEAAVQARLAAKQLKPLKVKKKAKGGGFKLGTGVNTKDLVTFTRLFATMIDAGLPIVQCLDILQGQTENKHFGEILRDVKATVEGGLNQTEILDRLS